MAIETEIQWADTTSNPIMGCLGCELFPNPREVLASIDAALAGTGVRGFRSGPVFRRLAAEFRARIPSPTRHHKTAVTTTNIWHLREAFRAVVLDALGKPAAAAAEGAIARSITCYAAKLHLNKGYSLLPKPDGTPRIPKAGYAPTFEEVTAFEGRVRKTARLPDLRGKTDPERPWIDGLPRLVFVSDMGDALSRKSDFPFLRREVIGPVRSEDGRRHLWLWLTKRPENMAAFAEETGGFPDNLCAMTTVTGPDTLYRVDALRRVRAKTRGLSMEPLRDRVNPRALDLRGIHWVIAGGESGKAEWVRPFAVEWAEEMRDHCAANGVAFFLKQLGRVPTRGGTPFKLKDTHGGDWGEWDAELQVRRFPDWFRQYRAGEGPAVPGPRRKRGS